MAGNSFGQLFRITTAGESHGPGNVVIIDGVPNHTDEYVPGYSLWHLTVGRRLGRHLELQGGAFNLFDLRRPALMPFQPGRRWFVTLTVHV